MKRTATVLLLAISSPALGQTVCDPRLGGGFSCYDYDADAYLEIRKRFGYRVYDQKKTYVEPFRIEGYDPYRYETIPRIGSQFETFNYETGEIGIITPNLGGGFRIDKY